MVEITREREIDNILIIEELEDKLNRYKEDFSEYFKKECGQIIEYFKYAPVGMSIYEWLFAETNIKRLPMSAKEVIKDVKGLSKINGLSFIRQFKLADKLEVSDRWIRNITGRLKEIALIFSVKTNKIHYSITFALHKSVSEYIDTIIAIVFNHYQSLTATNVANPVNPANFTSPTNSNVKAYNTNQDSNNSNIDILTTLNNHSNIPITSEPTSEPTSGSRTKFSLAKCLYERICGKSHVSESKRQEENSKNKEGRHARAGSE